MHKVLLRKLRYEVEENAMNADIKKNFLVALGGMTELK
jgi:hypothetical protein